jgi:hypothetical protein
MEVNSTSFERCSELKIYTGIGLVVNKKAGPFLALPQ